MENEARDDSWTDWLADSLDWSGMSVQTFVPAGFQRYLRLQHTQHPRVEVARQQQSTDRWEHGRFGSLPATLFTRLHSHLSDRSAADTLIWALYWEGSYFPLANPVGDYCLPFVRNCHVFHVSLDRLAAQISTSQFGSPNLWWCETREWCVATEVDNDWSYIGGSPELTRALLADPSFNIGEVRLDDPR